MKKILVVFIAALFLTTALSAGMGVEELVAKCIEASGGEEAYKKIDSLKVTAKMHVQGMEVPVVIFMKRPHFFRVEITVQGMKIISAADGTSGWRINPLQGQTEASKMPEEDFIRVNEGATIDHDFMGYKEKGYTLEFLGEDELEGTPVYKVRMTMKSGDIKTLYIDSEYFLIIKEHNKIKRGENEFEVEEIPGDYREVAGIMVAHASERKVNGRTVEQTAIEKVEVNIPLEESMFAMPVKETEASSESDK